MVPRSAKYEVLARRRCLVCEFTEDVWEPEDTDEIGPPCSRCHAPAERLTVIERRRVPATVNVHAAALGRLGGLKGGPARAATLTASRRRAIARAAAHARWNHPRAMKDKVATVRSSAPVKSPRSIE
jgi:hypothetical protein